MNDDRLLPFDLPSVRRKKLTVDFAGGNLSSDGGLLLLREAERRLGVCRRLAEAMPDRRDPDRVRHAMFELVMARASAIACGYEARSTSTGCGMIHRPQPNGKFPA
jgi:Transposase DDE domain group 1